MVGDVSDRLKEKIQEKIPDDRTKTVGLYSSISVTIGAKYDLKTNISVPDGMTNGAECKVYKINFQSARNLRIRALE